VRAGVICFWTALALEHRAMAVWREQKDQRALLGRRPAVKALPRWIERMKERLGWSSEPCMAVSAWSLPDSPRMRGLGLGRMWAVLCPFCHEFHTHSPGAESGRIPHCCGERDPRRYRLEFAGPIPVQHRTRFYRSSKSGLPRLLHHWPESLSQSSPKSLPKPDSHSSDALGLLAA
jgi:hypothetical protein